MGTFQVIMSLLPFVLIGLGYLVGHWREQCHLKSLALREEALGHIVVTDLKTVADAETASSGCLVMGEAVIATDYFKSIAMQLRNLIGGEMKSMQSLVDRARREAIVRMLEQAHRAGATEVHNVRLETSNIRSGAPKAKAAISVEMLAFGTAVVRR
jgi:uncharacterized protein YbjQ (UPF0145 family)